MSFSIAEVEHHLKHSARSTYLDISFVRPMAISQVVDIFALLYALSPAWRTSASGSKGKFVGLEELLSQHAPKWESSAKKGGIIAFEGQESITGHIFLPPPSGPKRLRGPARSVITDLGAINMIWHNKVIPEEKSDNCAHVFSSLFECVEAYYGYIAVSAQIMNPWLCDRQLHGIFWMNGIGPEYVDMIGREKLNFDSDTDLTLTERGSILARLTPSFTDSFTVESLERANAIMDTIGAEWFTSEGRDPHWLPKFKYMAPEES